MKPEVEAITFGPPARPHGMVRVLIDPASGDLAGPACPDAREEWFSPGTEPTEQCRLHRGRIKRWLRKIFGKEKRSPAI